MSQNLVNFKDFKIENLIIGQIAKKTAKQDPSATYFEASLSYKYEKTINGSKVFTIDDFYLEFPELTSNGGIVKKENPNSGKIDASIFSSFDLSNEDINEFVKQGSLLEPDERGVIGKIYYACLRAVFEGKSAISSLSRIQREDVLEGSFSPLLYWQMDDQGIVKGKNPSKFLSLINYGDPGSFKRRETLFNYPVKDANGKPKKIDWQYLEGVNMSFIPNIHFKKVYIGSKITIQTEVQSAVITKINKIGDLTSQTSTIDNLIESNYDLTLAIESNINDIKNLVNGPPPAAPQQQQAPSAAQDTADTTVVIEDSMALLNLPGLRNLKA